MLDKLTYQDRPYKKEFFSASDFGKWDLELYLKLTGVPETNPSDWRSQIRMGAGEGAEARLLTVLKQNGVVWEHYDQEFDGRVVMQREGLEIHGYMDAVTIENELGVEPGVPIEIKTINNKNQWDISKYTSGNPRENYVGQLAIYIDYLDKEIGYLLATTIDGLHTFFLPCRKVAPGTYQCGQVIVNVHQEYKRWSNVYKLVQSGTMPNIWTYRYKYPLDEIDWSTVSAAAISKARNGHAVIGDWQVLYSPYKNLIIELQGATLGYNDEEIAFIREKTKGYSSKK